MNRPLQILLGCEVSQSVLIEMRKRGHHAFSCDTLPTTGPFPEYHIQCDVLEVLNDGWDLGIFFPPCTHLAVSGAKHFAKKREDGRQRAAIEFFCRLLNAPIPKIGVENPIGIISGDYVKKWFPDLAKKYNLPRKADQIIQPYYFGDPFQKSTCLWLNNLPELVHDPKDHVSKGEFIITKSGKKLPKWYSDLGGGKKGGQRSKTFQGIAAAMSEQWTENLIF